MTGATSGFPMYAAEGAKEAGGFSFGLSPAASKKEHLEVYRLPLKALDAVIYTGFGFPGRDLMLVRSSDAVIVGCGRIGTIHEFTIAFEEEKPIGILRGPWATDELILEILEKGNRPFPFVIFDEDPDRLVKKIREMILQKREQQTRKIWKDE
jgi:uncharacterized protein (TIGR00725 family)